MNESNKKVIVQICFSLNDGLTPGIIRKKLAELKKQLDEEFGKGGYECRSYHLSKVICEDRCLDAWLPELFDEIFGKTYVCELTETNFKKAVDNIDRHRVELARKADRLVLFSSEDIGNVALELKLFTENRVMIL